MAPQESATLPAPEVMRHPPACGKWEREYQAFQRLLPELLPRYRGKYVVIHDGQVVASGENDLELALDFFARHGNVPVHIARVAEHPEPVTRIPHYRELAETSPPSTD